MLEKYLERKIVNKAKKLGYRVDKFRSLGNKGVPDRIYTSKSGNSFYIEFKRKGVTKSKDGKLSEMQKQVISDLITRKQLVFVINDEKEAMEILEKYK